MIQQAANDHFALQDYDDFLRAVSGGAEYDPSPPSARPTGPAFPPIIDNDTPIGNYPGNQRKPSSKVKKSRLSATDESPQESGPHGMMMIDMDAVPMEYRQLVAQWCKPMPAATADGHGEDEDVRVAADEAYIGDNCKSATTDNPSKAVTKRGLADKVDDIDHDTTSNKKRVRSCGEMSLYQSCYSQPAYPAQPYGAAVPQPKTATPSNTQSESIEKRARRTPSPKATKSGSSPRTASEGHAGSEDAGRTSAVQAARGSKRKNQLEHARSRDNGIEEPEIDEPRNNAPAATLESRRMANINSQSRSQATRGSKRKSQLGHEGFRDAAADIGEDSDIEEPNRKASAAVLAIRKIATPSSRFREV